VLQKIPKSFIYIYIVCGWKMVAKKASPTERHFVSWNEKPIHIIINTVALQPPIKHIAGFRFQYGIYIKGDRKSIEGGLVELQLSKCFNISTPT